jgi:hypothetical protein
MASSEMGAVMKNPWKQTCLNLMWAGAIACGLPTIVRAQQAVHPESRTPGQSGQAGSQSSPLYRVTVVERSTKAINYSHAKGSTPVDFKGTVLMPFAKGEARVEAKRGVVSIFFKF